MCLRAVDQITRRSVNLQDSTGRNSIVIDWPSVLVLHQIKDPPEKKEAGHFVTQNERQSDESTGVSSPFLLPPADWSIE